MNCYPIYYLRKAEGNRPQLWKVDAEGTWGLTPLHTAKAFPTTPDRQIWDINAESGWRKEQFVEPKLAPGQFYQRIARPFAFDSAFGCPLTEADHRYIAEAVGQLEVFCRDLDAICRTVHPAKENYSAFGHDIRNLLILACTEIEAHWKGILRLNGRKGKSTTDYVALLPIMKLNDYELRFNRYSWLGQFSPFQNWGNKETATADLLWYAAYNGVKHNREQEFHSASLEQAFNAVAACAILLVAQFGLQGLGYIDQTQIGLLSNFGFTELPQWDLEDHYIDWFSESEGEFQAVEYPW
ncbi:hypothetical protein [Asticcacaulis endophyticus]|uniref:Uncharacterized protein n=1 Tax=Asticcacaulis endophyticus TaxID=1395890 RepID=A0A918UZD4_9CAUL|nr:hypothetical protein [Asticcacaulis endophyticus]GGZ44808.1 hypothetical protein GCM10011273_34350 [Asticcacaulis endophyticus]